MFSLSHRSRPPIPTLAHPRYRLRVTESVRKALRTNTSVVLRTTPLQIGVGGVGGGDTAASNRDARLLLTSIFTEMMSYVRDVDVPSIRVTEAAKGWQVSESVLRPHRKYAEADRVGVALGGY